MSNLSTLPILVVEQDKHLNQLLKGILLDAGVSEIQDVASPAEAYDLIPHWNAGLIITGYKMEPESGIDFVRRLRSDPSLCFLSKPIIMTTAVAPNRALVEEIKTVGIDALVPKPIVPSVLFQGVDRSLLRARARVEHVLQAAKEKQRALREADQNTRAQVENNWAID